MIKFFRKIRYNLMEENKTGKYFKYAIGEIVLVVIGILIALSINNWNENNKNKAQTRLYLEALNLEIQSNITYLKNSIDISDNIMGRTNIYLTKLASQNETEPHDSIINLLPKNVYLSTPGYLPESALDDFINSGSIKNITDVELKNKILKIESQYKFFTKSNEGVTKIYLETIDSYFKSYLDLSATSEPIGSYKIPKLNYKPNRDAFINNMKFSNYLIEYIGWLNYSKNSMSRTNSYLTECHKAINDYLDND
ncbi:MAG: hypothetical protein DRI75_13260 [Bacteroidetes bacterium]|nr:MAG: hypothetical protein DRI75_13260 [Bacteroidota bacterium]